MTLRLTYTHDNDRLGELRGVVHANGFAGTGAAWFGKDALFAFCDSLRAYPLPAAEPPTLAGGRWGDHGTLDRVLFLLQIAPAGGSGALRVMVQFTDPHEQDEPDDLAHRVRTWFVVGYNDLDRFQAAFRRLLAGEADQAVLGDNVSGQARPRSSRSST